MGFQPLPLPWSFDPSILLGLAAAAVGYSVIGSRGRAHIFWLGLLAFAVALITPLDAASDRYLLSAHMLQHILLTMVGPPLLLAGLPRRIGGALPNLLVNPWLAVILFNVVLMGWHVPALYQATLLDPALHIVEHLMFIGAALLFWWPVVGPAAAGQGLSPLMKIGYLAFAGVPPTVVGMIMALAPTPLYPFYVAAPRLLGSISAELDQQLAGILMFGLGNLIYFVPISILFMRLSDEPGRIGAGT